MSMPGPLEIVVILVVFMMLFGAKRLPEIGRALGEGIREFKKAMRDGSEGTEDKKGKQFFFEDFFAYQQNPFSDRPEYNPFHGIASGC